MKNYYLSLIVLLASYIAQAQIVNIPDANFKNQLINRNCADFSDGDGAYDDDVDTNDDGEIQQSEAEAVLGLRLHNSPPYPKIDSVEGIEYFINLTKFFINYNALTNLDMSQSPNLTLLDCFGNSIQNLNISQNPQLIVLNCSGNEITNLDVSSHPMIESLGIWGNEISNLDVSQNPNLRSLNCQLNNITELDVSQNPNLRYLTCNLNNITELDVSQNPNLEYLSANGNDLFNLNLQNGTNQANLRYAVFSDNPNLDCIQVDNASAANTYPCIDPFNRYWCKDSSAVYSEDCSTFIVNIPDVNFKSALIGAGVDTNMDGEIQQGEASAVLSLLISNRNIVSLEGIEYFLNLQYLNCASNQISILNLSFNHDLQTLICSNNELEFLNIQNSNNVHLDRMWALNNPNLTCIMVDSVNDANSRLCDQSNNTGWCKDSIAHYQNICGITPIIDFPDPNFLSALLNVCVDLNGDGVGDVSADFNGDGAIEQSEAESIIRLVLNQRNINSVVGLEYFTSLRAISLRYNNLTSLDLSQNSNLIALDCRWNELTTLNLNNPNLTELLLLGNNLTSLDISGSPLLEELECPNQQLTSLITNNPNLKTLDIRGNDLEFLDVSQSPNLEKLYVHDNQLLSLDVSQNLSLEVLECDSNQLTSLDVSQNPNLIKLDCYSNDLHTLNIQNGANTNLNRMFAFDNFDLYCIEVDDEVYANSLPNCQEANPDWCISATTSYSENCPVLGINDNESELAVTIYPNPARDRLFIDYQDGFVDTVAIYSLQGILVSETSANNEINVSNLASGLYFISIASEGKTITKKFVKI